MEHSTLQGRFQARFFWTVLALLALAVFPLVAPALGLDFYISYVRRVLIYALAATSLNLILGYGGMVALGHAAFFGAGAYAVGILAMNGVTSALVAWPAAALLAGLLAAATGAVSLRTRGVYFIMITLAFAQMLFYIFISLRQYGGEDGLNLPGHSVLPGLDLGHDVSFYYVVLALFAVLMAVFGRLVDSRFGKALQGVRENESRMESLGYPQRRRGRAGGRAAGQPQPVHLPQPHALDPVGQPADHGAGGGRGPALGRRGRRRRHADAGGSAAHVDRVLAPAAGPAAAVRGVRCAARPDGPVARTREAGMSGAANPISIPTPALEAKGLVRRFGALLATDHVSLSLAPGEIHALIGPNGAGKSTLIHLLSGTLAADAGTLVLAGRDVNALNAHQRVAAGLSRSFQITNIFKQSSVLDNLVLAVQAHAGSSFSFWRPRAAETALYEQARELARECAIDASLLQRPAGTLPHGEQRKLEFALALAARPGVLLLDEPMAGMGPDETLRLTELIESLRGRAAMLLVEHDMQAVFRLADRISVLVYGRIIATGTPDEIRGNADVRQAYLGDEEVKEGA